MGITTLQPTAFPGRKITTPGILPSFIPKLDLSAELELSVCCGCELCQGFCSRVSTDTLGATLGVLLLIPTPLPATSVPWVLPNPGLCSSSCSCSSRGSWSHHSKGQLHTKTTPAHRPWDLAFPASPPPSCERCSWQRMHWSVSTETFLTCTTGSQSQGILGAFL